MRPKAIIYRGDLGQSCEHVMNKPDRNVVELYEEYLKFALAQLGAGVR